MTQKEMAESLMEDDESQRLGELLQVYRIRLQALEIQKAKFGDHAPPQVDTEIAEIRRKIVRAEARLGPLVDRTKRLQTRRQAFTVFYAKEWERAEELLGQVGRAASASDRAGHRCLDFLVISWLCVAIVKLQQAREVLGVDCIKNAHSICKCRFDTILIPGLLRVFDASPELPGGQTQLGPAGKRRFRRQHANQSLDIHEIRYCLSRGNFASARFCYDLPVSQHHKPGAGLPLKQSRFLL